MSDGTSLLVFVVSILLLVVVPLNGFIAWEMVSVALEKPRNITSLNLAAINRVARFLASLVFAILGAAAIYRMQSGGEQLLPTPWPLLLIAFGALVISVPSPFDFAALRRWRQEAADWRQMRLDDDSGVARHRRSTDPIPPDELP